MLHFISVFLYIDKKPKLKDCIIKIIYVYDIHIGTYMFHITIKNTTHIKYRFKLRVNEKLKKTIAVCILLYCEQKINVYYNYKLDCLFLKKF